MPVMDAISMNSVLQRKYSAGISLMEVLITMIIILIGLLGIVALQAKAQVAELEAYQRAQALILLSDITDRLNVNRATATCFDITTNATTGAPYLGVDGSGHYGSATCTASTTEYNDLAIATLEEIDATLKGTAEALAGASVGAMVGARACISYDDTTELLNESGAAVPGTGLYKVIITWQGMGGLVEPAGMPCAVNLYGSETQRRAVATSIRLANLY